MRLGRLDVLVNMASVYTAVPFDELTVDDWDAQLDVDLRAAWLCARAAAPHMRRLRGGRIINFADWTARSGRPRYDGLSDRTTSRKPVSWRSPKRWLSSWRRIRFL